MFAKGRMAGAVRAAVIALVCAGGAAGAEAPAADGDAYYLIAAGPGDIALVLSPGDIANGLFVPRGAAPAAQVAADGFILGKLDGSGRLAVTGADFPTPTGAGWGLSSMLLDAMKLRTAYAPCGDQTTVAFAPVAGKVLYIGILQYAPNAGWPARDRVTFSVGSDLEKARAFLREKYPFLADRLEQGTYEFRSLDRACQ